MNSRLLLVLSSVFTLALSFNANALFLEYKGFYQRLAKLEENELKHIDIAFYLVTEPAREPCNIKSAELEAKEYKLPISFSEKTQLDIPFDEKYYKDKAILFVEEGQPYQQCTLQMQIQVKSNANAFTFKELATFTSEMGTLMDDFGGFLWFIMPSVDGLTFRFNKPTSTSFVHSDLVDNLICKNNQCQLIIDTDDRREERAIEFVTTPEVISPYVSK